ncbi:MAG: RNA polymerase factor sigma-54 [Planctomycetes bacterium]|nr:RNA polymerase factor sigma-54 [Planctomycetota bacterium]
MSMGMEQKLQQKQSMILAPRMIQSMEILQLPILALQERIEQEIIENPILEIQELDPDLPEEQEERENPDSPADTEKELVVDEAHDNVEDFERLLNMGDDFPDAYEERSRPSATRIAEESDRKHDAMANAVSRHESLYDYLDHQLGELELEPTLHAMCERIISGLDSNGYLKGTLEDMLPPTADEELQALAQEALHVVQSLEPPGVGARSLRECLLLQLTPSMPYYEELKTLISGHLEDLRDNRLPAIQRKTGYSLETIQHAWDELRKLNPKPGAEFSEINVRSVTPDLFVDRDENGKYKVRLEDGETPTLRISSYYRKRLLNGNATPEEREFIKRKINAAQWLIESIEQRRSTLTRVAQAIIDHQTRFLEEGPEALEPLKMQQIADKVGVHVTTVSRAVDDKWIQTQRGIYPLKRFFVGGTKSDDGEDVAWDTIRVRLQDLIDREDKHHPYSDDELVKQLKSQGYNVARRTITKYRKKMRIPSSRQRRVWTE